MSTERAVTPSPAATVLAAAALLAVPLIATQLTDEVAWGPLDFAVAAVLLVGAGFAFRLVSLRGRSRRYRLAGGIAVGTALLLIWANLAVGVIGNTSDPANLMYVGVLAVAAMGTALSRLEPRGMARAMGATALAQTAVAVIALVAGLGEPLNGPLEVVYTNGFFVALWVASAALFRSAGVRTGASERR